jgi:alkylation response protein AidB-like acyl-CoA dehydrogenase
MLTYTPPLRDFRFVLHHLIGLHDIAALPGFEHMESDVVDALLDEAGKFLSEVWAPLNRPGDEAGIRFADGEVELPEGFVDAYRAMTEGGWNAVPFPDEWGGGDVPWTVVTALQEMMDAANASLSMAPGLTWAVIDGLLDWGTPEQQATYLPKLVSGEWAGTMNLTEAQAGSDVGALTAKAVPAGDGTWRLQGTKIYISWGDHDATDNIIHLVLARTPDSPPGTKGISMFIVPKFLVNPDGSCGDRNDVVTVSVEHKLGIHASPTCLLEYGGQSDGAVAYLIGPERGGMKAMFTMMNNARIGVGVSGVALGDLAYQAARAYAMERVQGRPVEGERGDPIIGHADVRRMLMTMKAYIEASRALVFATAAAVDRARRLEDEDARTAALLRADLLTPVAKAWPTDLASTVASLAMQVFGGMGYIEETGVAQVYRDARISSIYEGTNGIQAIDLVGRKLPSAAGAAVMAFIADISELLGELEAAGDDFGSIHAALAAALGQLQQATGWLAANGMEDPNEALAGATPYLEMFGLVAGGYYLARSAVIARDLMEAGGADASFLEAKIVTARFYCEQLLPRTAGLAPAVMAGKRDLFALDPGQF